MDSESYSSPIHLGIYSKVSLIRDEFINTENSKLFGSCENEYEVENTFEAFWNRTNGDYSNSAIVKVLKVEKVTENIVQLKRISS
tara:strand:- start:62 stop:316 length:255 start_codon:yes stop_codon:yes gene_type:complete